MADLSDLPNLPKVDSLELALVLVNDANLADPNSVAYAMPVSEAGGGVRQGKWPLAFVQGVRASYWLQRLSPSPSVPLQVAVRAHHINRWTVARADYPDGRAGYHRWKRDAKKMHGDTVRALMTPILGSDVASRAADLVQRVGLGADPESQLVEDCACLVFLETQFEDLVGKLGRGKVVDAVRKTITKMSPEAIALAGEAVRTELGASVLAEAAQPAT